MVRLRSSLFLKTLFWLFLNLTFLPIILLLGSLVFNNQILIHDMLSMQGHERMNVAFSEVTRALETASENEWDQVLSRFSDDFRVDLVLLFADGSQFTTMPVDLDEAIIKKVRYSIDQAHSLQRRQARGETVPLLPEINPIHPDLLMQTGDPSLFWTGIVVDVPYGAERKSTPAMLAAVSSSITGNGFFFNPWPWIFIFGVLGMISILLWIPVIRHITKPLGRMMLATEKIAKGDFDVAIMEKRDDEIGRLARAINRMSRQLENFVSGQRRFMGDVAHELGSPIARIQFGLGALEQRVEEGNKERVQEVMDDVDHMSTLVHELLELTRIDLATRSVDLVQTRLLPLVEAAVKREFVQELEVVVDISPDTEVVVAPDLLIRAVSNLIRNSIKYAGDSGPIQIRAYPEDERVVVVISDHGPGVAEEYFEQLCEPFYRPDLARSGDSGGFGLGLAIVKSCIDNCQGSLALANLDPKGFAVTLSLLRGDN
jgi:two-component system sensor histidine kinase CpxA